MPPNIVSEVRDRRPFVNTIEKDAENWPYHIMAKLASECELKMEDN
jgi:hypothetical protein